MYTVYLSDNVEDAARFACECVKQGLAFKMRLDQFGNFIVEFTGGY